jgi:lysozyme
MKISSKGIDFIKQWEKFEPMVYRCPAGKLTIGYGHALIQDESYRHFPKGLPLSLAEKILINDLLICENCINNYVLPKINQNKFDALCSLIFNIGVNAFKRSEALKLLNQSKFDDAALELFSKEKGFVYAGTKVLQGLINRRNAEWELWNTL